MSSAILYVAIVAIWIGVLVPRWLRHDTSRSGTTGLRRFSRHFGSSGEADDRERAGFDPEGRPRYTSFVPPAPDEHTPESHPESEIHHEEKVSSVASGNRESMAQLYEADAPVTAGNGSAGNGSARSYGPVRSYGWSAEEVTQHEQIQRNIPRPAPARDAAPVPEPGKLPGPRTLPELRSVRRPGGRRPARPGRGRRARRLLRRRGGRGRTPGRDGPQPSPDALDAGRADRRGYRPGRRAPVLLVDRDPPAGAAGWLHAAAARGRPGRRRSPRAPRGRARRRRPDPAGSPGRAAPATVTATGSASVATPYETGPRADIIDLSERVGDQLYDQYADAKLRAVGD